MKNKNGHFYWCIVFLLCPITAYAAVVPIPAKNVNFHTAYDTLYQDTLKPGGAFDKMLSSVVQVDNFTKALNPDYGDLNCHLDPSSYDFSGNSMLDADYELAIISTIMNKPPTWSLGNLTAAKMIDDWNFNANHWMSDDILVINTLYSFIIALLPECEPLIPQFLAIITGFITLGDGTLGDVDANGRIIRSGVGTISVLQAAYLSAPASYMMNKHFIPSHFRSYPVLQKDGDADGDGYSNYQEYQWKLGKPDEYLCVVLDATQSPSTAHVVKPDFDGDGLSDEYEQNTVYPNGLKTDWQSWDTDKDGIDDGMEVNAWGTDPTASVSKPALPMAGYIGLSILSLLIGATGLYLQRVTI